jgi:hypothetical protein
VTHAFPKVRFRGWHDLRQRSCLPDKSHSDRLSDTDAGVYASGEIRTFCGINQKKESTLTRLRNQRGCLRGTQRKTGPSCWEFLWRENDADGNRTRRTAVIGTVEQFPARDLAQAAMNGLRMSINQDRNRQRERSIVVADLVDHYIGTELSDEADWHSHATRIVYSEFLQVLERKISSSNAPTIQP